MELTNRLLIVGVISWITIDWRAKAFHRYSQLVSFTSMWFKHENPLTMPY